MWHVDWCVSIFSLDKVIITQTHIGSMKRYTNMNTLKQTLQNLNTLNVIHMV